MNKNILVVSLIILLNLTSVLGACSDGQYAGSGTDCWSCPENCSKCTDYNTCTECKDTYLMYEGNCYQNCPVNSAVDTDPKICVKLCTNTDEFPTFSNGVKTCGTVANAQSDYCIQQAPNLKTLNTGVKFELLQSGDKTNFNFRVLFFNTPSNCFTTELSISTNSINPSATPSTNPQQINGALQYVYSYPINQMDSDHNGSACANELCTFTYKLFWQGMLQYTYKVAVKINNSAVVFNNDVHITGDASDIDNTCVGCEIPKELQIEAGLSAQCQTSSCYDSTNGIRAHAGDQIQIVQTLPSLYANNDIIPFRIQLVLKDSSGADAGTFLITKYTFDNSVKGQIIYTLNSAGFSNGVLTITSKIEKVVFSRLLSSENVLRGIKRQLQQSSTRYPQQSVKITITDDNGSESSSNKLNMGLIIGITIAIAVAVIAIIILVLYIIKRNKINQKMYLASSNVHSEADQLANQNQNQELNEIQA